jgi:hypothetical protein
VFGADVVDDCGVIGELDVWAESALVFGHDWLGLAGLRGRDQMAAVW